MRFTGKNLLMVYIALGTKIAEVHNEIVTCPEPEHYAKELAALEAERDALTALKGRVYKALAPVQLTAI